MMRRSIATALAAAAAGTALVAAAPAASAQALPGSCSAYPAADGAYGMRVSPSFNRARPFTVNKGAEVRLSARLFRSGRPCADRPIGFYARGPFFIRDGKKVVPPYHLTGKDSTDAVGLAETFVTAINDFRFFGNFNLDAVTVGAQAFSLVQVR